MKKAFKKDNKGFVILFAVTLASILIAIALGVANVALNEVNFSTSVKDSDNAFYAADTGAECALYNDQSSSSSFIESGGSGNVNCVNATIPLTSTGSLPLLTWNFVVPGLGSSSQSCAVVSLTRDFTNPSFPITVLDAKGYNIGDSSCASSNTNRDEREVQLNYSVGSIPVTNGVCAATYPACIAGTSINNDGSGNPKTWSCAGYSGGTTASCSENLAAGYSASGTYIQTTSGQYTIDTFTGSGSFTVTGGSANVDYLIVGGGGSGGTSQTGAGGGGGGGGGGVRSGSTSLSPNTYTVTVGSGGAAVAANTAAQGNSGGISVFNSVTSLGGGGGGAARSVSDSLANGLSGGSGGGAGYEGYAAAVVGAGTSGQGNSGGQNGYAGSGAGGGGGGGGGSAGFAPTNSPLHNGGVGGSGASNSISGSSVLYAAGGSGGDFNNQVAGISGAANTGNGGGGVYASAGPSGAGGSGVVIIRYLTPSP